MWAAVLGILLAAGCGNGVAKGHTCGMGAPCSAGAKCDANGLESGFSCACDASGHFFCTAYGGGGAPPWISCTVQAACDQKKPCSETNGYCTRTCQCGGSCSDKCDGKGPPQGEPGEVCDASYCAGTQFGSCSVKDGACDYEVKCSDSSPVSGSCP